MTDALAVALWVVVGANTVAAVVAGLAWARRAAGTASWRAVRLGQAASLGLAVLAGVAWLSGWRPGDGLFWLYAALPVAIGSIAEQLRVASAETVLEARGFASAAEVGERPEAEQRDVVAAVVRREIGVMAVAAAVVVFLALRGLVEL